ncbi:polar amino acid transport system substrate-binding protein [Chitinivorax tropicus]|uniref:Polar amino acid transport system substrate-binding protein n=1 Tax=Chitinivorax tropicus TaxID=714531 RepID=A0A840MF54_9PROT|nr:transporter substrate-binding domain-containing protein [Chitinivorax tropicus]MBB5017894.1 polar amino acid transport system substrate-binding protein [Chitinivorax tropicus]
MSRMLITCFVLATLSYSGVASALTLTTEDYPPFNMPTDGGKVGGISTEIVQEALKRAKLDAKIELLPWERSLSMAKSQADVCVYSAVRNAEREKSFKWVGPLVADEITLFAKADSPIKISSLDDAKKYKVGAYNGDAYGDFAEKQGLKMERVVQDVQNLPKLAAGRIDLWVGGAKSGMFKAGREGFKGKIKPVFQLGDPKDSEMWLACNKGMADEVVNKLNDAVKSIVNDGTAERIGKKYQ